MSNDDWFRLINRLAAANPAFWFFVGWAAMMIIGVIFLR